MVSQVTTKTTWKLFIVANSVFRMSDKKKPDLASRKRSMSVTITNIGRIVYYYHC